MRDSVRSIVVRTHLAQATAWLAIIAGLAYCSWPLGYLTTPGVVASALASALEAQGVPYAWLYIALDCLSGIAVFVVGVGLERGLRRRRSARIGALAYACFGLATVVDALVPLHCPAGHFDLCGTNLAHPNLDDVLTGLAMTALALAVGVTLADRHAWPRLWLVAVAAAIVWAVTGCALLDTHLVHIPLQHVNLTFTALLLMLLPPLLARRVDPVASAGHFQFSRS